MKRKFAKILGVGLALVLVCSFSLVTAVPVAAAGDPTTTLVIPDNVYLPAPFDVSSTTTNPDAGTAYDNVRFNITISGPEAFTVDPSAIFTITHLNGGTDTQGINETFVLVDGDFVGNWGPVGGFTVTSPYDITSVFTILMNSAAPLVEYNVTVGLVQETTSIGTDGTASFTLSMEPSIINIDTNEGFNAIQYAIDAPETGAGDTITVAAGEYAGAIVNEDLNIIGAAGGASIITSGVPYKVDETLYTGFRLDADADGAEIRNFTMNGDYVNKFWFGVFARSADSVIVDSLTLDDMVQGITNWGGSGWEITNNVITETYPTYGGGIAIYLGADPTNFPHCDNNLVQYNIITTNAVQNGSFTGAAICLWFDERTYTEPTTQSMTGNEIIGNSITASGLAKQVGIEIGVGGLDGDNNPDKVAACLGVIHDNTVTNNTIDNAEWGLYIYVTTNLTVQGNTVKNCSDCGIYMKDDHTNCLINNNDIYGNTNYGLNNTDGVTYSTTVDAIDNWWGSASGPTHESNTYTVPAGTSQGDAVSDFVDFVPWLDAAYDTGVSFAPVTTTDPVGSFASIQAGVTASNPNGTVNVAAGTYVESPTTTVPLNLVGVAGEGGALPTLVGTLTINSISYTLSDNMLIDNMNFLVPEGIEGTDDSIVLQKVEGVTIRKCSFDGNESFIVTEPDEHPLGPRAVQMYPLSSNVTIDNCTFKDGYYTAISGYVSDLTVTDSPIENCKSGINLQGGDNLVVENTDISVIAQGEPDTYCVRFASSSEGTGTDMNITGGIFTVDKAGFTPEEGNYHSAIIVRAGATGTLKVEGVSIGGEVVNLSTTQLDATSNWWGTAVESEVQAMVSGNVDYSPWLGATTGASPMIWYTNDSIQDAIDSALSGDTINVAAGMYPENITIDRTLTLEGAQAGKDPTVEEARTDPAEESTIQGSGGTAVTVDADVVVIDGFTITNPSGKHGISAVDHSNIIITYNIVTDVGSSDTTIKGTNQGIAIISSAAAVDNITIAYNQIRYIIGGNFKSAQGIVIGHSTGDQDVTNLLIQKNVISNITSDILSWSAGGRVAYGILLSHGTGTTGKTVDARVLDNTISDLEGFCAHGIGLEGNTPGAVVERNDISHLIDHKWDLEGIPDAVAVQVEDNASADTVGIHLNNFSDVLLGVWNKTETNPEVDATNNWWGTAIESQIAKMVSDNVDYSPWLDAAHPDGVSTSLDVTTISLKSGWNLISLPLIPDVSAIETVLAGVDVDKVAYYTGGPEGSWRNYTGNLATSDLTQMQDGKGYWVDMGTTTATLTVKGYEFCKPAPNVPPSYNLVEGWNLIGFKSLSPIAAGTYLDELKPVMRAMYGYDAAAGLYTIILDSTKLVPGDGYWLAVSADGTIYP